jgi:hypothetical protein
VEIVETQDGVKGTLRGRRRLYMQLMILMSGVMII